MSRQPFSWALLLSIAASACASSQATSAPAASEPVASEPAASEAATPASAPAGEPEAAPATDQAVNAATSAAQSWLALVDAGQYDESWKNAAEVFRKNVSTENWAKAAGGVRGQLGKLGSRKVSSAQYTTSLPGAPDGQYVVIQFDTTYEHKAAAVETVTPMLEADGSWHVAGYFVK